MPASTGARPPSDSRSTAPPEFRRLRVDQPGQVRTPGGWLWIWMGGKEESESSWRESENRATEDPRERRPAKRGIRPPPLPGGRCRQPTKATTGNPIARRGTPPAVHGANIYRSGSPCLPAAFAMWIRNSEGRFMPDPIGGFTLKCPPAAGGSRVLLQRECPEFRDRQRATSSLLTFRPAPALGPREGVQICTLTSVHVDRQMGREQPADIEPRTCPQSS